MVVLIVTIWLAAAVLLLLIVWLAWHPRGRCALVVYSDSPVWQEYFELRVLPAVGARAAVLNWSRRRSWRLSLPVALFQVFGGTRDYNPLAIVFVRWRWPRRFRFHRAFRAFKHGRPAEVDALREEFLLLLDAQAPGSR
jgi:hypothetical protein